MINAGLPIVDALETLALQQSNKRFNQIIKVVARDVASGTTFAESLRQFPNLFTDIFVNMIAAGEESGKLDEILLKLADHMEKDYEMAVKTRGAMIYPAFILTALISVMVLLTIFLIPKMKAIFETSGAKLPMLTRVLFGLSDFMIKYKFILLIASVGAIWLFRYFINTTRTGQNFWASFIVKIPVFGGLMRKIYMARFARTATTLLESGLSIVAVLELTSRTIGNIHYEKELMDSLDKVKNGENLSTALRSSEKFPRIVIQMIQVGEKTGALDEVMGKLASFYEKEVDEIVDNFSKLLEPFLIVAMGVAVALVVAGIVVPLYDLTSAVKNQ